MEPHRAVVVDDSSLQCKIWKHLLEKRYGDRVQVETYDRPAEALEHLTGEIDLLLIDWEMPDIDGREVLRRACAQGVDCKRIIVSSAHPAAELHKVFDSLGCLAVIEKNDPEQQAAFMMILDSIMKRPCKKDCIEDLAPSG